MKEYKELCEDAKNNKDKPLVTNYIWKKVVFIKYLNAAIVST